MALYDLSKEIDKNKATKRFKSLIESERVIELKTKQKRSLNQNSYLHLILSWYGYEYGVSTQYVKHEIYKKKVNIDAFGIEKEVLNGTVTDYRSTADLDSAETTHCIERFRNWSSSDEGGNIYLPSPNEGKFLQEIEILIKQNEYV